MLSHYKNLNGAIEIAAVTHCKHQPWCIPGEIVLADVFKTARGRDVYWILKNTVVSSYDTVQLVVAMFKVMAKMHASQCLHLDFHPKNIVLSEIKKESCITVKLAGVEYGCYAIDFETMWYPDQNSEHFDAVTRHWNAMSPIGLGRMFHNAYDVKSHFCFDVYTMSVYLIKYLNAEIKRVDGLEDTLYAIAGLDCTKSIPGISTIDCYGEKETYYAYLMDPVNNSSMTTKKSIDVLNTLANN